MKFKNIIFDLDGTLLDTSEGIKEAVRFTVQKMGFRKLADNDFDAFIGPPIQISLKDFFGCSDNEAQKGADIFRDYYKEYSLLYATSYSGIFDVLAHIKHCGSKVAVATYKREDYALKLLHEFGFSAYCDVMHGADNFNKFSKADIIKHCVDELGSTAAESVYIGDTFGDYKAASACGMEFIGVTYGFGFQKKTEYGFQTVDNCYDLMQILEGG